MNSSFHYLVMAEQAMVQKALLARIKGSGLTLGQPKVLDYLKDHNGASQKDIAGGCHIEAGSLTSILNRMEERGIVERRMLHGNRRSSYVFLTEKEKNSGISLPKALNRSKTKLSRAYLNRRKNSLCRHFPEFMKI